MRTLRKLLVAAAIVLVRVYRIAISALVVAMFGRACRFEPTCSEYAEESIRRHGFRRGSALTVRRLSRCHPLGGHGYDPVPQQSSPRN